MSTETTDVSNVEPKTSSEGTTDAPKKEDVVSYDSYAKLLNQRKADQSRLKELQGKLEAIESAEKERESTKLKEQGEYKKLLARKEEEFNKLQAQVRQHEKDMLDAHKLQVVKSRLPGDVLRPEYLGFIDLDKIPVLEDGTFDEQIVEQVAQEFTKNHSGLIRPVGTTSKLPNQAPNRPKQVSELSLDEKLKLIGNRLTGN